MPETPDQKARCEIDAQLVAAGRLVQDRFEARKDDIEEQATKRGQRKTARQIRKLSPYLYDRATNLKDVKVIFDPVEYVVFQREKVQISIDRAIQAGNLEWQTFRVQSKGSITQEK